MSSPCRCSVQQQLAAGDSVTVRDCTSCRAVSDLRRRSGLHRLVLQILSPCMNRKSACSSMQTQVFMRTREAIQPLRPSCVTATGHPVSRAHIGTHTHMGAQFVQLRDWKPGSRE
ncbi:unnamed protein product [Symbiodinium sp. CCMP2592]|nr:unnamed protein product [Symbiodinium sp. CCMP2592]